VTLLVAGIGNIFQGDDAFGCEVVKRLASRDLPEAARLFDFGIRGLDLTYALLDDPDLAILIDAAPGGEPPGTLYLIEPPQPEETSAMLEAHGMNPVQVLQAARALGARPGRVLIVGCEPGDLGGEDGRMGLTAPVAAAVDAAAQMVFDLIQNQLVEVPV